MVLLTELPYHRQVMEYFLGHKKTWDFFAQAKTKDEDLQKFKTELLKNTYKFSPEAELVLYQKLEEAKQALGMENLPVTVYQAQFTDELNATISYQQSEAHIIFSGPLMKLLSEDELKSVLAHELTHIKLYSMLEGKLEVADRIITSIANNHTSDAVYYETARRFRLYTEIFCDRGSFTAMGDSSPVISSLVKVSTGLEKVDAASYLKQADEIMAAEQGLKTAGISHPENYIRAKAVELWKEKGGAANDDIVAMIEGVPDIDQLDIFRQKEIAQLTKTVLQLYLKPKWAQSPMMLSLARQYFTDFSVKEKAVLDDELVHKMKKAHNSVKDYLAYILLDLSLADPSLEEVPLGWAFQLAEDLQIKDGFDAVVKKEKKLSEKRLAQQKQKAIAAYHDVKENNSEQIYEG